MADLTVAQCREFPGIPNATELPDASLLILLNAAIAAVNGVAGATGENTEHVRGHGFHRIVVGREIGTITSVTEDGVVLATDDYRASGYVLTRIDDGTNPRHVWAWHVVVTYTPADDAAERQRVQLELVKLDLAQSPGLASQTIGTWAETYRTDLPYAEQRAEILASLGASGGGMRVVD